MFLLLKTKSVITDKDVVSHAFKYGSVKGREGQRKMTLKAGKREEGRLCRGLTWQQILS